MLDDTPPQRTEQSVEAADYDAFYLWPGVKPLSAMEQAETAYLLWGELRIDDPSRIVPLRRTPPRNAAPETWLVVRAERLDWGEGAYDQLLRETTRWQAAGVVKGVQVDFDAATTRLGDYAAFLTDLRERLPDELELSTTGLMDWPANASHDDLAAMRSALDHIVIQTYRETETIPDYARYLARIDRLDMPFRIALVQNGQWCEPEGLASDPHFEGYVVFLLRGE